MNIINDYFGISRQAFYFYSFLKDLNNFDDYVIRAIPYFIKLQKPGIVLEFYNSSNTISKKNYKLSIGVYETRDGSLLIQNWTNSQHILGSYLSEGDVETAIHQQKFDAFKFNEAKDYIINTINK
jgi:hypothetical protein